MSDKDNKNNKAKGADYLAEAGSAMEQWQNFQKYGTKYPTEKDIAEYKKKKDKHDTPRR